MLPRRLGARWSLVGFVVLAWVVGLPPVLAESAAVPLRAALTELQARGLPLVFSSAVVLEDMVADQMPDGRDPRAELELLLAPHQLAVVDGPGGTLVVVRAGSVGGEIRGRVVSRRGGAPVGGAVVRVDELDLESVSDEAGSFVLDLPAGTYMLDVRRPGFVIEERAGVTAGARQIEVALQPAPLAGAEIAVHPSRVSLLREEPIAPLSLSRQAILSLPQVGGDGFRALDLLPGVTSNDFTAQPIVRGSRRDELLVLFDGQELYEAYHLIDFERALSLIPLAEVARLDLNTGAWPPSYGDRMGAVLELTSLAPPTVFRRRVGLSLLGIEGQVSGGRGDLWAWRLSARRGSADLVGRLFDRENPEYWDLLGRVDLIPTNSQTLRLAWLTSDDRLSFAQNRDSEARGFDTNYDASYVWLAHQSVLGRRVVVDSALSWAEVERDRRGFEDEEEKRFEVIDQRELEVSGFRQAWFVDAGGELLEFGFDLRRYRADYDYRSDREFYSPFVAIRAEPRDGRFDVARDFDDNYEAGYVSTQLSPWSALTLELGMRFDSHSLTGDEVWSPRASLAWKVGRASVIRAAWGYYHQSQRAYEIGVIDADLAVYPAERSDQWVVGFEHLFEQGPLRSMRLEAYSRRIGSPRPRYESLFEPREPFPEGELDRIRIAPTRSRAEGFEVLLQGRRHDVRSQSVSWWGSYTLSRAEDQLSGVWVPRSTDQRHAVSVGGNLTLPRQWELALAWRYHTGWPTGQVGVLVVEEPPGDGEQNGEDPGEEPSESDTELIPVLESYGLERVASYHRLDLRLSRSWKRAKSRVTFYLDGQNVYGRSNVAGFDLDLDEDLGVVVRQPEYWPGFFASLGVIWEF